MRTIVFVLLFFTQISFAQILPEKERALLKDEILEDRFKNLLPGLMEDANIDMWLLISREYNEDPVLKTMLPATWLNARRRTIIVFYRNKKEKIIERLAVARYNIGKSIQSSWDKEKEPSQWKALVDIIASRNPDKIGINFSKHFALADGLVKTGFDELLENLPETYQERLVSAEKLAIGWLETRSKMEMKLYKKLVKITHDIIDEAFSANVIQTGITTTEDIVWFMRQKVTDLGLETWFHPTVDIQRNNEVLKSHITSFSKGKEEKIIQKGDLLHCDFGITYIGLNTDCQQQA
jgi:Xaa-Pro aminopeptidase